MKSYANFVLIIIFLKLLKAENDWPEPHFINAKIEGIRILYGSNDPVIISVQEEIKWPFKLIEINYKGEPSQRPSIGIFSSGNNILLNASIILETNKWFVQINNRQDYENPDQRFYSFEIYINNENNDRHGIAIELQNIFDNAPEIDYNGPCEAKELESNLITNCMFTINDIDGMRDNKITLNFHKDDDFENFGFTECIDIGFYHCVSNLTIITDLQYEHKALYRFNISATDAGKNTGWSKIPIILQVINIPHKNPIWIKPLITVTFKEKQDQVFQVKAVDGDTGINLPICYNLTFFKNDNYNDFMRINETSGVFTVNGINRDAWRKEIFKLMICAFKCNNITQSICNQAILIVEDINDNLPLITIEPNIVEILENSTLTIPLNQFHVSDIDLGIHATYEVILSQNGNITYSNAFDVIPQKGYQNSTFMLTVTDKDYLDYEKQNWKFFDIKLIARETYFAENKTSMNLKVKLINWNDEIPTFDRNDYSVSFKESVSKYFSICNVTVTDRDIDDYVTVELMGYHNGLDIVRRSKESFEILTTEIKTFDYEQQTTVILQLKASDTLTTNNSQKLHETYTQLTINVIDVNDKTPELKLPRIVPNITENSSGGTLITKWLNATDPDTTANITFDIDWKESYATKAGREAKKETYQNCFIIEPFEETRNKVYGHLKINPEFAVFRNVDYELYDSLYLLIRVTDLNQEINDNSTTGILIVTVDDVNDNAPEFVGNTLIEHRYVEEEARGGTLVGSINAIDIDGPPFNIIQYSMIPINDTALNLAEIHTSTGIMKVMDKANIDCDIPKITHLYYEIILTDGLWITKEKIQIMVIDINNKKPHIEKFQNVVYILENSTTGSFVGNILSTDLDRDEPHNILQYLINFLKFPNLEKFFRINQEKGEVFVELQPGQELDRDHGILNHTISIDILDNYRDHKNGRKNTNETKLFVVLLDVNDNAPELPNSNNFKPKISESANKDALIEMKLIAKDIDEPNHPNSYVSYEILAIQPDSDNAPDITNFKQLFGIKGDGKEYGQIYAKKKLIGFYGSWNITIKAYDHGLPKQSSNNTYLIQVEPYNFYAPIIIYPTNEIIRLSKNQRIGTPLLTTKNEILNSFEAFDPDGGKFGDITFEMTSFNGDDSEYFKIIKETRNKSRLEIKKRIQPRFYQINLKARDGGDLYSGEIKNLTILVVDMKQGPIFKSNITIISFTENIIGLSEYPEIPEAFDPKNKGTTNPEEIFEIFYYIDENYNEDSKYFKLHKSNRKLSLNEPLDRENQDKHFLRIIATNSAEGIPTNPDKASILFVTVKVIYMIPKFFDIRNYGGSITTQDPLGKLVTTLKATDKDHNGKISYSINRKTMKAFGENIELVKYEMFQLNADNGVVTLAKNVDKLMKGFFEFNVLATDTKGSNDEAYVKIFVVSESNRIDFIFLSEYSIVLANAHYLKSTLTRFYEFECEIDDISNITNHDSEKNLKNSFSGAVAVRVHFISNNEAVEATEIQRKSNLNLIATLKKELGKYGLYLNNIQNFSKNLEDKLDDLLIIILIGVSIVLTIICTILVIICTIKTRAMNRQVKAFTTLAASSIDLNENKFILPGGQTISKQYSMQPSLIDHISLKRSYDFDYASIDSDDFAGIQNDPIFLIDLEAKNLDINQVNYEQNFDNENEWIGSAKF